MTTTTTAPTAAALPEPTSTPTRRLRPTRDGYKVNWWLTALMLVASLTVLVPLYFSIVMALKTPEQIANGSGFELPNPVQWSNFSDAYTLVNFPRAFLVTALITVVTVIGALLASSLVAYAIARNWEHRFFKISYIYLLSALFIPFPVIILPLIRQTALLGIDNPVGVTILHIVGGVSFFSLLYIAFIRSLPTELEESARLDGASTWQVFRKIIFPLLAPMNATVGIFAFLAAWNDFLLPQMMIADPALQTLPVVQLLFQGQFNTNYGLAFASYLMAMGPVLIAYLFSQRWVMSGVMRGAVK
jgi:raffinose/stachyose/melibiose transport system permease protein